MRLFFNVTERDNGQPRAIQPQSLFASQQFATAIYQSELTYRLRGGIFDSARDTTKCVSAANKV
jgi:hypothetical protein